MGVGDGSGVGVGVLVGAGVVVGELVAVGVLVTTGGGGRVVAMGEGVGETVVRLAASPAWVALMAVVC